MKRLMSISLVLALVLALGSLAFANEGPLGTLAADIDVFAKIGPYAKVEVVKGIDFGELLGAVNQYDATVANEKAGQFKVETNTDVKIHLEVENPEWINSQYHFLVARDGLNIQPRPFFGKWFDYDTFLEFDLPYEVGEVVYDVSASIRISSISEQVAGDYATKILITVSK